MLQAQSITFLSEQIHRHFWTEKIFRDHLVQETRKQGDYVTCLIDNINISQLLKDKVTQ